MEHHIQIAKTLTDLLENKFRIGKLKFGFDPILGAIPGFGDVFTTCIALYVVWIGIQMRLPQEKIIEMIKNVAADFIIGILPVIGDLTDVVFKANTKNMRILEKYRSVVIDGDIVD